VTRIAPSRATALAVPLALAALVALPASLLAEDPPAATDAEALLAQLGSEDAGTRRAAEDALAALGESARAALERARDRGDAEVRGRADSLLRRLDDARTVEAFPWTGLRGGPSRSGVAGGDLPHATPSLAWSADVPDPAPLQGALVATQERVFTLARDGTVRAYAAQDGTRRWLASAGAEITASGAAARGRLVLPTARGVVALATADGHEVWRVESEYGSRAAPAVVGGRVWIALSNLGVRGLDVRTGSVEVERRLAPRGALLADADLLVVGSEDGTLRSLDPRDGRDRWTADLGHPPVMGPTLAANGIVAVLARDRVLRALRAEDGKELWRTILPSLSPSESLAAAAGRIFVTDARGAVRAFDSATGRSLWVRHEGFVEMGAPCATAATVVFGARGRIGARDADSGDFVWRVDVDRGDCSSPVAAGGGIFVLYDGQLRCWR
jgi:outer membrane protein assembly factor BamB